MSSEEKRDKLSELLNFDTESDENVTKLTDELTNSINIETKTSVDKRDVVRISKAIAYSRRYGIKPLDIYVRKVMLRINVSIDRGGRKDIVDALTGVFQHQLIKQKTENVKV